MADFQELYDQAKMRSDKKAMHYFKRMARIQRKVELKKWQRIRLVVARDFDYLLPENWEHVFTDESSPYVSSSSN